MKKRRFFLRDLPLSARITLAAFLLSVGLGYVSAMVQLHMQHAGPDSILPSSADVVRHFHGSTGPLKSHLQSLIEADEALPFNGSGSMAAAFTKRSEGWAREIKDLAKDKNIDEPAAEVVLRTQRAGERAAVLAWLAADLPRGDYDADNFTLPADSVNHLLTAAYKDGNAVKIQALFKDRCARCHAKDGDDEKATHYPMETFEQIKKYGTPTPGGGRVSLDKLAQTTHAHLLSFAVLFTFTGLLFALTNYPSLLRLILAPLVLVTQVADIACWWLARIDGPLGEQFALAIPITGAIVGIGLMLQIVLTLFHLFGALGRLLLLLIFAAGAYGGWIAKEKVVDPFLKERSEQVKKG
jgi:cytochrome c553